MDKPENTPITTEAWANQLLNVISALRDALILMHTRIKVLEDRVSVLESRTEQMKRILADAESCDP